MRVRRIQALKPNRGWVAIAAFVILWDNLCEDGHTLSEGFWNGRKWVAIPLWLLLTSHLLFKTPLPLRWLRIKVPLPVN